MKVGHTDSKGGRWVFDLPVSHALQANMFARFLRHLRNLGKSELRGHLRPTDYVRETESLSREIEKAVLRALLDKYPATDGTTDGKDMFIL